MGGLDGSTAPVQPAADAFNNDNAGVDNCSDRKGETAEGHHVDCHAGPGKAEQSDHHRQWQQEQDGDGRNPTAEKHRHYDSHKSRSQQELSLEVGNGVTDVARLVSHQSHLGCRWNFTPVLHPGNLLADAVPDAIHHCDGVAARLSQQWAVNASFTIDPDNVGLNGGVVASCTDIPQKDRTAIPDSDWNGVDFFLSRQRVDGMHLIVGASEPYRTAAKDKVAFTDGGDNVSQCQVMGLQPVRVDVDHHLSEAATEGMWDLYSGKPPHFVPDGVVANFVKLGFTQSFTGDGGENHRQVGRFTPQREGMLDARWQMEHVTGFEVNDVIHRRRGVGSGLEGDFQHTRPRQGPGFLLVEPSSERQRPLDA